MSRTPGPSDAGALAPDEYYMGPNTLKISRRALHLETRKRLTDVMKKSQGEKAGIVFLQGGSAVENYSSDTEMLFTQDHSMFYLFGIVEEGWFATMDLRTGTTILFMPRHPESYSVWLGPLKEPRFFRAKYAVDAVHYVDEMPLIMDSLDPPCLHVLSGTNSDSGKAIKLPDFDGIKQFKLETESLFPALNECRVKKNAVEIEIIAYANKVASKAHVAIMQAAKAGMMEYQIESTFLHTCYFHGGARTPFYTPISASGPNASILHYGHAGSPNDRQTQDGDYILADFGCEYYHYGSDITTTWPVSGKFVNSVHHDVYETVLKAHVAILAALKPGVSWPDMQTLAYRIILGGLLSLQVVRGDVEHLLEAEVGALFMPHGVGHFLGLQVHDVGGYPEGSPPRSTRPGYSALRTARKLEEGMVITVEPGCYFNPALLLPALQNAELRVWLNKDRVTELMRFGGVRLEDNVLITAIGCRSFTDVPRTVADIERVMAGEPWPLPAAAEAPAS